MATITRPSQSVEKANYHHLVMDIAWFGVALAATTRFLQFYALHMGATALDLGWLTSLPALVLIFATMLSGWWRNRYETSVQAVWWPGIGHRMLFLLPALAPFFPKHLQVPWLIVSATLPTIAQGVAASVFVVMMRETITQQDFQPLLARRQMAMNLMLALGAVGFGFLLTVLPYPINYQVMFVVAFGFAMISQYHLGKLQVLNQPKRKTMDMQKVVKRTYGQLFRDRNFQSVALVTFSGYFAFHLIISVIPLHLKALHANEGYMGLYGAVEVAAAFSTSFLLTRAINRFGNRGVITLALVFNALAALVLVISTNLNVALLSAVLTGSSWSAMMICIFGFFVERTPKDDIQSAIVYHQVAFGAIFAAPMIGSGLVNIGFSVVSVLALGIGIRIIGAIVTHLGLQIFGTPRVEPIFEAPPVLAPDDALTEIL